VPETAVLVRVTLQIKSISSDTHKGRRDYQEDRLFTLTGAEGTLLAIFDGHGGADVAHLASEQLPAIWADEITAEGATPKTALQNSIQKLNILTQHYEPGSTISLVFIPANDDTASVAIMGDSPVIIKDAEGKINISPDHNVRTNYIEAEAAKSRGGFVEGGYLFQSYDGMGLQMARALGDSYLNKVLSRTPEIYGVKINKDSFIIAASDGCFDPGHYDFKKAAQTIVELVERGQEANELVHRAAVDYPTGDNVSCIVARFNEAE
jgi:serine/threonine protein phosphatase PrpC